MKNQQSILCDVCMCKHHNKSGTCKLSQITVTPSKDCETAHYCKDYEEKQFFGVDANNIAFVRACVAPKSTHKKGRETPTFFVCHTIYS